MQLDPAAFNEFLANMGQSAAWRRSYACPCVTPASGSAKPSCPHCHGKGRLWDGPVDGILALSGQRAQKQWADFGLYEAGDVVLTLPSDSPIYAAGQFDRIVLMDSSVPFTTNLIRGGQGETLKTPCLTIDRVFWITAQNALVEGGIPTLQTDGTLYWPDPASAPPAGMTYSISGRARPEYYVYMELPSDRAHHGGAALPRKVAARKFDLFGR